MSEMEDKLGAILGDPQMMQQIMSMAQALGSSPPPQQPEPAPESAMPKLDPGLLKALSGMAKGSAVDSHQQSLLNALCPYMSQARVQKLEKAMKAAKLAGLASSFLSSGGLQMFSGR